MLFSFLHALKKETETNSTFCRRELGTDIMGKQLEEGPGDRVPPDAFTRNVWLTKWEKRDEGKIWRRKEERRKIVQRKVEKSMKKNSRFF